MFIFNEIKNSNLTNKDLICAGPSYTEKIERCTVALHHQCDTNFLTK